MIKLTEVVKPRLADVAKLRIMPNDRFLSEFYIRSVLTRTFASNAKFNPLSKNFDKSLVKYYLYDGAIRKEIPESTIQAIKSGKMKVSKQLVLGVFYSIYKNLGENMLYNYVKMYIDDFIYRSVPYPPSEIVEAIKANIRNDLVLPSMPNEARVAKLKILLAWDNDLTNDKVSYCRALDDYPIGERLSYRYIAGLAGCSTTKLRGVLCTGQCRWTDKDIMLALYWCIAAKVHPIKLLNTAGLFITDEGNRPPNFTKWHKTIYDKTNALILVEDEFGIKYKERDNLWMKHFSGQFIAGFAREILDITFIRLNKDLAIEHVDFLTESLVDMLECVEYEDLSAVGFVKWKAIDSPESCDKFLKYLKNFNYSKPNLKVRRSRKRRNLEKANESMMITGNPIFDNDLFDN